jgi:hypothetical protein
VHHDALEFADGTCVLLTDLLDGQEATVLQLPAQPKTPAEEAAAKGSGVARIFKVRKQVKGGHNSCDDQVSKRPPCRHLGANTPHVEDERTATPWGTRAGDPNR